MLSSVGIPETLSRVISSDHLILSVLICLPFVGRCGWQSEVAGCRVVKSVPHYSLLHFLFFLRVGETASVHVPMPTAAVTAGYASLTSSANGKAGLRRSGTPAWQLLGRTCVHSECAGRPSSSNFFFIFLSSVSLLKLHPSRFLCKNPAVTSA